MNSDKTLYPLFGIIAVLNTPFTCNNKVDKESLKRHVQYALEAGVAGFLVPGLAAEVQKLTNKERQELVEVVMIEVDGRVPVIVGAGDADFANSLKILQDYLDMGCENVLFNYPFSSKDDYYNRFLQFANLNPDMIMIQDWSASGYGLPDDLLVRLFEEVEAFRCLKIETVPAGVKYSRLIDLTDGRLHVSGGWAVTQMIEALDRGVHALMPTGMYYTYMSIYQSHANNSRNDAQDLFEKLLPVLAFSNQHLDISIHFFKRLLHRQGIYKTDATRKPILSFDDHHLKIAERLILKAIELEEYCKQDRRT